ncbi:MAG: TolC family protein [Planctomycetales bacterium]|nr:TolC family protein [Planctomycetales bacterium]
MPRLFPILALLTLALCGCTARWSHPGTDLADYQAAVTQIEYPTLDCELPEETTSPPLTIHDYRQTDYWDLTLDEAVQMALQSSKVLRDLGGRVLSAPDSVDSIYSPALVETDPRFGVEAALSAFDAQWKSGAYFENNDRALNNQFLGGGTRKLQQDLGNFETSLSKRTATGGEYRLKHSWDYDANNAPGNEFPSAWTVMLDAEFTQPLLRGQGLEFNRVYGPDGTPGLPRGVLVARMNTDISLAEFHTAVRQLINDVETTYWELQFAYRDLDAKLRARHRALKTWHVIADWKERGRVGGEADKEAAAREQYYRLHSDVQLALTGRAMDDVRSTNFRGQGGVQSQERRLRLLIGAPINDGRLIRPVDKPSLARVEYDWTDVLARAMVLNPDLLRQRWVVKRQETVAKATRNLLLPEVNVLGRYRWRGFGHDLLDTDRGNPANDNAFDDLTGGDFQEWQLGMEMLMPVGNRQGHLAYRNAVLSVARERALLEEQQRQVTHHLSAARGDLESSYEMARTQYNRLVAAHDQLRALETLASDPEPNQLARLIDQLLVAQRTLADAETRYYRELAGYEVANKNIHYYVGSLLSRNGVHLMEGEWPEKAYHDAAEKRGLSVERYPQALRAGPTVVETSTAINVTEPSSAATSP